MMKGAQAQPDVIRISYVCYDVQQSRIDLDGVRPDPVSPNA